MRAIFEIINDPEFANISQIGEEIQAKTQQEGKTIDEYLAHVMANGESTKGHEADIEKYMMSHQEFLVSLQKWVEITNRFAAKDPKRAEERKTLLRSLLGENATIEIPVLQADKDAHGGLKKIVGKMPIPESTQQVEALQQMGQKELLHLRATLYRITGDKQYEASFETLNQQTESDLLNNTLDVVEHTENVSPDDKPLQDWASGKIGELSATFQELQASSAKDPLATQTKAKAFLDRLNALSNGYQMVGVDEGKGANAMQIALARHLYLKESFSMALAQYTQKTEDLLMDTFANDPKLREYRGTVTDVVGRTNGYIKSAQTLFQQVQKTGEVPSKTTMAMFHGEARNILGDPAFNQLLSSGADGFIGGMALPDEHVAPRLRAKILELQKMSKQVTEYLRTVNVLTRQVIAMEGHGVGPGDFSKDAAKYLAITAAAVAGTAIATVLTGGLAAGPVAVLIATSLGAAIGSQLTTAAIEGNADALSPENMAKAWVQGAAASGGGAIAGKFIGMAGGRMAAAISNKIPGLSKKASSYMAQELERLAQQAAKNPALKEPKTLMQSLRHIAKEISKETGEEFTEDAMQKIGEGLAPNHPELGFLFTLIPSATKTGRATFKAEIGKNTPHASPTNIVPPDTTTPVDTTVSPDLTTPPIVTNEAAQEATSPVQANIEAPNIITPPTTEVVEVPVTIDMASQKEVSGQPKAAAEGEAPHDVFMQKIGKAFMDEGNTNLGIKSSPDSSLTYDGQTAQVAEHFRSKGFEVQSDSVTGRVIIKDGEFSFYVEPSFTRRTLLVLDAPDCTPEKLIDAMSANPKMKRLFDLDAGNSEKYTVGEHTAMVMRQFEKYFKDDALPPEFDRKMFRVLLLLHDVGKGIAVEQRGDNKAQHAYTLEQIDPILRSMDIGESQSRIIKSLISGDPFGQLLTGKIPPEQASILIGEMARKAQMPVDGFYKILKIFYQSDAASYTVDAGGKKSLDGLFKFDPESGKMDLIGDAAVKVSSLETVMDRRLEALSQKIDTLRSGIQQGNMNIEGFREFAKTPADLALLDFVEGKMSEDVFQAKLAADEHSFGTFASTGNSELSAFEKMSMFVRLERMLNQKMPDSDRARLTEVRQMLKDGRFGSDIYHGTSSVILRGLEKGGPELLSSKEIKNRSIGQRSGEGDIAGGTYLDDTIALGMGVDGAGTALAYAELNIEGDGYRNPLNYSQEELSAKIAVYQRTIADMKASGQDVIMNPYNTAKEVAGTSLQTLQRELSRLRQASRGKEVFPDLYDKSYPLVFGMKRDGLRIDESVAETRQYGKALSGEVSALETSISLVDNLDNVFVPSERIEEARAALAKVFAAHPEVMNKIRIYSIESLDSFSRIRAGILRQDSVFNDVRDSTFDALHKKQQQRFQHIENFTPTP